LIIPKYHSEKLDEVPDQYLADILPLAKKIALSTGHADYNLLQVRPIELSAIIPGLALKQNHRTMERRLSSMSHTFIFT
jgi:hypothetical protein